ncbi:hypothetical protein FRACA_1240004 [Frankia canadensis]|uniref:Uncharacterized protein n=1 Tax=Frankia canadensis TaxID=1836972 RepID=A0A2I2KK69_9ACTN|nr:hypothetical protein FRACA_1240004 [Frankia canadensis]SOU53359.1 hypothetical protein FRACA_1240004 [Frankia canadensis]
MVALVRHVESGAILDFGEPDLGGPNESTIFDQWRGRLTGKDRGRFVCALADCSAPDAPVYFQLRGRTRVACHYDSGVTHRAGTGVSDEHKRQQDYLQRSAEDAGYEAVQEGRLRSSRPDVLITGGLVPVGAEVQRSRLTKETAARRDSRTRAAGVQTMWLHGNDRPPAWSAAVPSLGTNQLPWSVVHKRGSWTVASGVGRIRPRPCTLEHFGTCPAGHLRHCRGTHPKYSAEPVFGGLTVDRLAELVPERKLLSVRFRGRHHYWVPANDAQVYLQVIAAERAAPPRPGRLRGAGSHARCDRDHSGALAVLPVTSVVLDWSDDSHWSEISAPCIYGDGDTNLLDDHGRACHKVCAERWYVSGSPSTA